MRSFNDKETSDGKKEKQLERSHTMEEQSAEKKNLKGTEAPATGRRELHGRTPAGCKQPERRDRIQEMKGIPGQRHMRYCLQCLRMNPKTQPFDAHRIKKILPTSVSRLPAAGDYPYAIVRTISKQPRFCER